MNKYEFFNEEKSIIRHNLVPAMLIKITLSREADFYYLKKINDILHYFTPLGDFHKNEKSKQILKRACKWYISKTNKSMSEFITNGKKAVPLTKFLMCVDHENRELYVYTS